LDGRLVVKSKEVKRGWYNLIEKLAESLKEGYGSKMAVLPVMMMMMIMMI
jgi:hypothetical protein